MNRSISSASITTLCVQPSHDSTNNPPAAPLAVGQAEVITVSDHRQAANVTPIPTEPQPSAAFIEWVKNEFKRELPDKVSSLSQVATRLASEVDRICRMSQRIQASGEVLHWQRSLARHRINKCVKYFQLGSNQGRVELHGTLSAIAYRYIAPRKAQLGFEGRRTLLEDFLQGFYIEALKAFRRENAVDADYSPRTRLQLSEYMTFCEQYAKRRITIPGAINQQIIVLRAQTFARRQPDETSVDIERAMDSAKSDEMDGPNRSAALQQVREQMVTDAVDPADQVLRDRIIQSLIEYLEQQDQHDCIDYFVLRLQDLPAAEIDEILNLSSRQRDYLQQRFKYHVEKFAQVHNWHLVHQWLGIDLEHNLGLSPEEWSGFITSLEPQQQQLLQLRRGQIKAGHLEMDAGELAELLGCTPKRVNRIWGQILNLAWKYRNQKTA
ncbi:MAG: hypothetical protein AAFR26_16090 [Cyanobacteria bacterium J06626_4]